MNVIIEPLSAQAWVRVEANVMARLENAPLHESSAPRARALGRCKLARSLRLARRRFASWIALRADQAPGVDEAPASGVRQPTEPLREPWALPLR
jgi:hypothetical protein